MPGFRCTNCRTRLETVPAASPCPACGAPLERVASRAELMGYRLVRPDDGLAERIREAFGSQEPPGPAT